MGNLMAKNRYFVRNVEGEDCVVFLTGGKTKIEVVVDIRTWQEYLYQYHWTAVKKGGLWDIKTSIDKHSRNITRVIVEREYNELDYFGNAVDHINNDRLDNRIKNLRLYSVKLNATNIRSKYENDDLHLIFPQRRGKDGPVYGYKVHTNVFDETIYRNFGSIEEARHYRDTVVLPYIEQRIKDLQKKTRDVEFERGVRDKIRSGEIDEVVDVLRRYGLVSCVAAQMGQE